MLHENKSLEADCDFFNAFVVVSARVAWSPRTSEIMVDSVMGLWSFPGASSSIMRRQLFLFNRRSLPATDRFILGISSSLWLFDTIRH